MTETEIGVFQGQAQKLGRGEEGVYPGSQREYGPADTLISSLASVAQLVGALSCNQKVVGSIPGQGTYLGCGFNPQPGNTGGS